MFVRLLVPPLIFASFIRSISRVISSFSAFHVSNVCLNSTGAKAMGRVPLPPPSREDSTTRAFTLVNVYGCPIASRNCRSLSLRAKCCNGGAGGRRTSDGTRSFKGVLCFIAGRRYESNAFAEYFRSYEMKVERRSRPGNLSYLPAETYLSSRPINVPGPRLLFFSLRDIRPRFKIAYSPFFHSLFLLPFPFTLFAFRSFFRSSCRSHLLVDISSFSPSYLRSFQVPFVVRSLFLFSPSTARLSDTISLFSSNLLTTFQPGKVMRTGYPAQG